MTIDSLSKIPYGQVNANPNYGINREFGKNITPTNTASEGSSQLAATNSMPWDEKMNLLLQLQETPTTVEGAHQASASSNPYAAKGPEWNGIAFPPSDGNGNFVPVVAGGDCGNEFDSVTWLENFGRI